MSAPDAVISIGTNSTRVLVADLSTSPPRTIVARSIGTRIGEGLRERGTLAPEAMRRTLEAVRAHARTAIAHDARVCAIATSALRRADNGAAFAREVEAIVGAPLHVLSGEEEAVASYRGAIAAIGAFASAGVLDTGGGSTEYAVGAGAVPERIISCELGAVRLTEAFPALSGAAGPVDDATVERADALARAVLKPLAEFPAVERLVLVGGSATTVAALLRGNRDPFLTFELLRRDVEDVVQRLRSLPLHARTSLPGMNPQRADILLAGTLIVRAALDMLGHERATSSTADLLLGYLLVRREDAGASTKGTP